MVDRPKPRLVSVIIPMHNAEATIADQLEALTEQRYEGPWEVIVVDNASTDASVDAVMKFEQRLPALKVVAANELLSRPYARNQGASAARGDLLAMCDADDVVVPGWLGALVEGARSSDIVGGSIDGQTLNSPIVYSWRPVMGRDALPTCLSFMPYALGGNVAVWKDVVDSLGGWNESYARGGTEIEFAWRAQLAGFTLSFAPEAIVKYRFPKNLSGLAGQAYWHGRVTPRLYREFRRSGLPRWRLIWCLYAYAWLVLHSPKLVYSRVGRGVWIRRAAFQWGRLVGSLRYRVACF